MNNWRTNYTEELHQQPPNFSYLVLSARVKCPAIRQSTARAKFWIACSRDETRSVPSGSAVCFRKKRAKASKSVSVNHTESRNGTGGRQRTNIQAREKLQRPSSKTCPALV